MSSGIPVRIDLCCHPSQAFSLMRISSEHVLKPFYFFRHDAQYVCLGPQMTRMRRPLVLGPSGIQGASPAMLRRIMLWLPMKPSSQPSAQQRPHVQGPLWLNNGQTQIRPLSLPESVRETRWGMLTARARRLHRRYSPRPPAPVRVPANHPRPPPRAQPPTQPALRP